MKKRLKYALLCGALLLLGGGVALGLRFYSGIARDPMRAFTEPVSYTHLRAHET